MFKQIQNYIKLLIVCLIVSNISFTQIEGCTDPEAYNCADDIEWSDYIFDIGGTKYDNSCNWDYDIVTDTPVYVGGCDYNSDNLPDDFVRPDDCQGYYNDATDACRYYQAPLVDDVNFDVEEGGITVSWTAFIPPALAVLEAYGVQRCVGASCLWLSDFNPNMGDINTSTLAFDDSDFDIDIEIKYAISVVYSNNPYWGWAIGASYITPTCPAQGNLDGNTDDEGSDTFNVLDIVKLANCVLASNCDDLTFSCAGDVNADGNYNVLDIVQLANCVLAQSCGSRVDDATESKLIMIDNIVSIEADGFIGGVEMTLQHGADFSIEMTARALFADYLTSGNKTRLLVITPETDELFSYSGDFEITEVIVANSQDEVPTSLPTTYYLSVAYPNPFNPVTTMDLTIPEAGNVSVQVYNLKGQVVATLASGYMNANTYTLTWDASETSSGLYFVKAQAGRFVTTQKLMLVK